MLPWAGKCGGCGLGGGMPGLGFARLFEGAGGLWIPACAGMTESRTDCVARGLVPRFRSVRLRARSGLFTRVKGWGETESGGLECLAFGGGVGALCHLALAGHDRFTGAVVPPTGGEGKVVAGHVAVVQWWRARRLRRSRGARYPW